MLFCNSDLCGLDMSRGKTTAALCSWWRRVDGCGGDDEHKDLFGLCAESALSTVVNARPPSRVAGD